MLAHYHFSVQKLLLINTVFLKYYVVFNLLIFKILHMWSPLRIVYTLFSPLFLSYFCGNIYLLQIMSWASFLIFLFSGTVCITCELSTISTILTSLISTVFYEKIYPQWLPVYFFHACLIISIFLGNYTSPNFFR